MPGMTVRSPASMTRVACSVNRTASEAAPTALMIPSSMATKPSNAAAPVAGKTFLERMTMLSDILCPSLFEN